MKEIVKNSPVTTGLYIVATPIGNLADITLRAINVLKSADFIACEDTRTSTKLLSVFEIKTKTIPYHDHNGEEMRPKILKLLTEGKIIALISDAGTPLISDPGYKLVRDVVDAGFNVVPIPGVSAPITALMAAGLPSDIFTFVGFLPPKTTARKAQLATITSDMGTTIFFESPNRIHATLADIASVSPDAQVVVARELTKKFEQFARGTATRLAGGFVEIPSKGEIVLLIRVGKKEINTDDIDEMLKNALKNMRVKDASSVVAQATGVSKSEIYSRALEIGK